MVNEHGAVDRDRTGDLRFTKAPLYQLSYDGLFINFINYSKYFIEVDFNTLNCYYLMRYFV